MSQEKEMNDLLSQSRIAGGASVFVSNGEIIIPIEDGQPLTLNHRITSLQELGNQQLNLIDPLTHTIKLSTRKIAEIETEIKGIEVEASTEEKTSHHVAQERKLRLESLNKTLDSVRSKHMLDEAELNRIKIEIEVYGEMIQELSFTLPAQISTNQPVTPTVPIREEDTVPVIN